jgi:hypothetical protein
MRFSCRQQGWSLWTAGVILGLVPIASFLLQYMLSVWSGTDMYLFRNYTVAYLDWIFIPFNFVVVWTIDWRRGGSLLLIVLVAIIANVFAHATWQYYGIDGGHMIARGTQTVLPAGWAHLGFSTIETTLILAFVFIRRPRRPFTRIATILAVTFFLAAGVSGYLIHHGFIATDVIMVWGGTAMVLAPHWLRGPALQYNHGNNRKSLQNQNLRRAPCSAAVRE